MKVDFFGKAEGGEFVHESPKLFAQHMAQLEEKGKRLVMSIKPFRKPRSTGVDGGPNQNGYYWAVIVRMVGDEIGEADQEIVHGWIQEAIGNVKVMRNGAKIPKGTSDMDTGEFEEFCSRARMWAAAPGNVCEAGLFIPLPNEADYE